MKIVSATATAVFSLAAVVSGTFAWFASNNTVEATNMSVRVKVKNCVVESVNLYKFNYARSSFGLEDELDYLSPQKGSVKKYPFDDGSFGVDEMTIYDPLEKLINGSSFDLRQQNCNAVYEIELSASEMTNAVLDSNAVIIDDVVIPSSQIALSEHVDFDLFTEDQLSDSDGNNWNSLLYSNTGDPLYWPSFTTPLSVVFKGSGAPDEDFGEPCDRYIDIVSNYFYIKAPTGWTRQNSVISGTLDPSVAIQSPSNNQFYVEVEHALYRYREEETKWGLENGILYGEDAPSNELGHNNDRYLDTLTNNLYVKDAGSWGSPIAVSNSGVYYPSAAGENNEYYVKINHILCRYVSSNSSSYSWARYSSAFIDEGAPEITGENDDLYLDAETRDLYIYNAGDWSIRTNLMEEKIYHKVSYLSSLKMNKFWTIKEGFERGDTIPSYTDGNPGDLFLDETTNKVYVKNASTWGSAVEAIKGTTDPSSSDNYSYFIKTDSNTLYHIDGSTWSKINDVKTGEGAPGITGSENDLYVDETNKVLYIHNGTNWGSSKTVLTGATVPMSAYYIKTNSNSVYKHGESSWELITPDITGTTEPNDASGEIGQTYLKTNDKDLFIKQPANWGNPVSVAKSSSEPAVAEDGEYYLNTTSQKLFVSDGTEWVEEEVLTGRGVPHAESGEPGNKYIDLATNQLYIKPLTSWGNPVQMTIGSGAPSFSVSDFEGDYYLDTSSETTVLYRYQEHGHFYDDGDPMLSKNKNVTLTDEKIKVYINVNYAPATLEDKVEDIYKGKIKAAYDFVFFFCFNDR